MHKNFKKRAGFSLIEIVVVIAIMAIIAALLVPALIHYTEDSRAQKDITTMDEVVNAVQLALADSDCFDEMELYSCDNNFITYTDSSGKYGQQVIDAEYWAPDGCAKATTITFNPEKGPNGETIYRLENAVINDMTYGNGSIADDRTMTGTQISDNQCLLPNAKLSSSQESGYLYNRIRQTVGNNVITTSATYANSSFTIFIRFSQKDGVTVADVNGSFNGTNLYNGAQSSVGSGTNTEIINPDTGNKEQGPATTPNGGTNKPVYSHSSLQGSGSTLPYKNDQTDLLQKDYEFEYYSSISLAAQDVNDSTPGKRADRDKEDAVAGIYYDENKYPTIILLNDSLNDDRVTINVDATLDFNNHNLCVTKSNIAINIENCDVTIKANNSQITLSYQNTDQDQAIIYAYQSNINISGGSYYCTDLNDNYKTYGLYLNDSITNTKNATIYLKGNTSKTKTFGVYAALSSGIIENCDITSITHYRNSDEGGVGIRTWESSNFHIKNCKVIATRAAVLSPSRIDGGTYVAQGYPLWIANSDHKDVKIKNATFIKRKVDNSISVSSSDTVVTLGGNSSVTELDTYIDNCKFIDETGSTVLFRMQGAFDERQLTIYISNTTSNITGKQSILNYAHRNHKIYIGKGCNFGIEDTYSQSAAFMTDEVYSW